MQTIRLTDINAPQFKEAWQLYTQSFLSANNERWITKAPHLNLTIITLTYIMRANNYWE